MEQLKPAEIEIKGKMYSIDKVPDEDSDIVEEAKKNLQDTIDLETLAKDLNQVGTFIQIACNGVVAAGPKFVKLQSEIQSLGYKAIETSNNSITTIQKFKKASNKITTNLQTTYQSLLNNQEKKALEMLLEVSKLAKKMDEEAKQLYSEFQTMETNVVAALKKIQEKKGDEATQITTMQKNLQMLELEKEHQQTLIKEQRKDTEEAIAKCSELEKIESSTIAQVSSPVFRSVKRAMNALTLKIPVVGFKAFDVEGYDATLNSVIKAIKRAQENKKALREVQRKSTTNLIAVLKGMVVYKTDEKMAEVAEEALHQAIGGLKKLSLVTMHEKFFWNHMYEHLASLDMQEQIKTVTEQQSEVWTSRGFKIKAIELYADWVALHSICGEYAEYIKKKMDNLYSFLQNTPTYEQSRQNVQDIVEEYLKDLKSELKAIEDQEQE